MLRLLHTADWQIGRVFSQFEPDDAAALFEARFKAVEKIAEVAAVQQVDAVLVAGDVFDAQTVADKTIRRLFHAMQGFRGPWLLLPGNHDAALAESVWTRARRLGVVPESVVLCLEPRPITVDGRFVVLPAPLVQRHTHGDLTGWFDGAASAPDLPRVGLAHGCVRGVLPEQADADNPIAPDRALNAGLAYLALGDWHGTRRIDARTWYAGTPESDRFRANDAGQALRIELAGPQAPPQVSPVAIGQHRWLQMEPSLAVASDIDEVLRSLASCRPADVVQLRVSGSCSVAGHRRLREGIDAARARLRAVVAETEALRLEPDAADLDSLRADGYVGDVLEGLKSELQGPQAELARDALLLLAEVLDRRRAASTGGAS